MLHRNCLHYNAAVGQVLDVICIQNKVFKEIANLTREAFLTAKSSRPDFFQATFSELGPASLQRAELLFSRALLQRSVVLRVTALGHADASRLAETG